MDDLEESWDGEGEVARRRGSRKERVAPVLVVRKKEDEAGAKAEEAGPLPDSQGLNFSPSLYLQLVQNDIVSILYRRCIRLFSMAQLDAR